MEGGEGRPVLALLFMHVQMLQADLCKKRGGIPLLHIALLSKHASSDAVSFRRLDNRQPCDDTAMHPRVAFLNVDLATSAQFRFHVSAFVDTVASR